MRAPRSVKPIPAFITLFVASTVGAQGATFIVDGASGPGAHFVDLQAAVVAVSSGSTLLVRPGVYGPVHTSGKSLTILCDEGVTATAASGAPFLRISSVGASDTVVVRALGQALPTTHIAMDGNAGFVFVDGAGRTLQDPNGTPLLVQQSARVFIRAFDMSGAFGAVTVDSHVHFESSVLRGLPTAGSGLGLFASGGRIDLTMSSVLGADGHWSGSGPASVWIEPAPAIHLATGYVRGLGMAMHAVRCGAGAGPGIAIDGNGTARIDAGLTLFGVAAPGVSLSRPLQPALDSTDAPLGGAVLVRRTGVISTWFGIVFGQPASPMVLPGFEDPLWLEPTTMNLEGVGFLLGGSQYVLLKAIPNTPLLRGMVFGWQAADFDHTGVTKLSNPSLFTIH